MNCKSAFFGILSLFVVSIIAVVYLGLGWSSVGFMSVEELDDKYIEKNKAEFYDLPLEVQEQYISRSQMPEPKTITKTVTKTVTKIDETALNELQAENEKLKAKLAEYVNAPQTELSKENFALYGETPVRTIRCSDFKDNQYFITPSCKQKVEDFITQYGKPAHFEIVSMIDKSDFHNFKSSNTDPEISMLIDEGLAKLRAKEVGWHIRQKAPSGSFYSFPPYQFSTDETKGVVINIY